MARLRGHATDPPGRWKEPRAFPATDHAAQRARQGRGRHPIRRRVRGQCGGRRRRAGSLIPHARAVRALMIAMIEAAFGTAPMALARGADRARGGPPCDTPASNTRGRDHTTRRSRRGGCSAGRFSGEAACPRRRSGSALRLDTALKPWHKRDDWLGPSEHRGGHRGSGGSAPGPHLRPPRRQLTRAPRLAQTKRLWTLTQPWTHRTRPQLLGNLAQNAGFPRASTAILFFLRRRRRTRRQEPLRRRPSRFTRFQVSADTQQQPVISVDTKKKELVGDFKNAGQEWQPTGRPRRCACTISPATRSAKPSRTASTTWRATRRG